MLFVVIYSLVSGALCATCAGELRQAFSMDCVTNKLEKPKILDLGKWLPWQQSLQPAVLLEHTDDSRMLVELLQYAVNKRCQIQPTQTAGEFCTTLRSRKEEVYIGHMFPHTSPPSVCQAYLPLEEKEEEEAIYFSLFIAVIIFDVDFNQISAFYSWYYNKLLISVAMLCKV